MSRSKGNVCKQARLALKELAIVGCVMLSLGCGVSWKDYKLGLVTGRQLDVRPDGRPGRIAVVELEDRNPAEKGGDMLCALPGVLYCSKLRTKQPEFGKCLVSELRKSQLLNGVDYYDQRAGFDFGHWDGVATDRGNYSLILSGDLYHDKFSETTISYGVSILGMVVLSLMGLPNGHESREVFFEVTAVHPTRPDQILLRETVQFEGSQLRGVYYGSRDGISGSCPVDQLQPRFLEIRRKVEEILRVQQGSPSAFPTNGNQKGGLQQ